MWSFNPSDLNPNMAIVYGFCNQVHLPEFAHPANGAGGGEEPVFPDAVAQSQFWGLWHTHVSTSHTL